MPSQALLLFVALILVFSTPVYPAAVSCSDFTLRELKHVCEDGDASPQVNVYDNVSSHGLNDLAESWNTDTYSYHVRVIPPGTYVIDKPIVMKPGNRLLPHPTMPLPAGKTLRTIELVPADEFQPDPKYFYLLKLNEVSRAGGVEIHGSKLPDSVVSSMVKGSRTAPHNTLVLVSGDTDTFLAASVLTGHQSLDTLYWNTATSSNNSYVYNRSGVKFQRNHLRQAGASAIAILSVDAYRSYDFNNNAFFVEQDSATTANISGILLTGSLKAAIANNDFILPPRPASGNSSVQRRAIEISNASGFTVSYNTMYTPGSTVRERNDFGVYDTREENYGIRLMGFSGNEFSPHMISGMADPNGSGATMQVMFSGAYNAPLIDSYHLDDPVDFMKYQGMLGAIPQVTAAFTDTNNGTCFEPDSVSDTGLKANGLSPARQYIYDSSKPCYDCPTTEVGGIQIFFAVVILAAEVAGGITCCIFCGRRGMGKSTCNCRRRY